MDPTTPSTPREETSARVSSGRLLLIAAAACSDGGDDGPVGAAVLSVVDTLSALEPEDLDTAMLEIKAQLATVQYMASLNKIAGSVLAYDGNDGCPFPAAHRLALKALFKRASVVQHSVFKVGTTPTLRAAQPRSAGGGRARSRTCR